MFATTRSYRLIGTILSLTAAAAAAQAGEIYKSIDANGNVVYSDHVESSTSSSAAVQLDDPRYPPHDLHFCWTNCFTLVLDHGVYRRADGTDETWTVETFTPKVIVLHRHDAPEAWNGYSRDVTYAGKVSNDRLIDITVNGNPVGGVDASWGDALNTLPGSNTERDSSNAAKPDTASANSLSTATPPPPLPGEEQPPLPQDGYLWTPGYWHWRDRGYVWISGAWVAPPRAGLLWTPAYWSPAGAVFVFHPGHWGSTVGFYGAANYGNGYFGNGYSGGHWTDNAFVYNSAVNHLNPAVAHHSNAESVSTAVRAPPPHPSPPALTQTATMTAVHTPASKEGDGSAALATAPPARAAVKPLHVPSARVPVPAKQ